MAADQSRNGRKVNWYLNGGEERFESEMRERRESSNLFGGEYQEMSKERGVSSLKTGGKKPSFGSDSLINS